jgi:glucan-binding YG repeat protein
LVVGIVLALALALAYLLGTTTLAQAAPASDEALDAQATGEIVKEAPAVPAETPAAPAEEAVAEPVVEEPEAVQATGEIVKEEPAAPAETPAAPAASEEPVAVDEPEEASEIVPLTTYAPLQTGWVKTEYGDWQYFDSKGNAVQGLKTIDGKKYFFYPYGYMAFDTWEQVNGSFYFFKPTKAGEKAPALTNGLKRPFLYKTSTTIWQNGKQVKKSYSYGTYYLFDKSGKALTGLRKVGNKTYYFDSSGALRSGLVTIKGKLYNFVDTTVYGNGPAALVTKLTKDAYYTLSPKAKKFTSVKRYNWYWSDSKGVVFSGWKKISGKWYYFSRGTMVSGQQTIGAKQYYFKGQVNTADGKSPLATGLFRSIENVSQDYYQPSKLDISYSWYYADSDGVLGSGWLKNGKNWYYFNSTNHKMVSDAWNIDGQVYYFNTQNVDKGGKAPLVTKLTQVKRVLVDDDYYYETGKYRAKTVYEWHHANADGTVKTGLQKIGANTYYFDIWGEMLSGWQSAEGKTYYFKLNEKTGRAIALVNGIKVIKGTEWLYDGPGAGSEQTVSKRYFFDKNGVNKSGWQQDSKKNYYYFELPYPSPYEGAAAVTGTKWINGKTYTFDKDGKLTSPTKP